MSDEGDGKKSVTNFSFSKQKSSKSYLRKTINPPSIPMWMLERIKYKVIYNIIIIVNGACDFIVRVEF
jgi:hypothetical protein